MGFNLDTDLPKSKFNINFIHNTTYFILRYKEEQISRRSSPISMIPKISHTRQSFYIFENRGSES